MASKWVDPTPRERSVGPGCDQFAADRTWDTASTTTAARLGLRTNLFETRRAVEMRPLRPHQVTILADLRAALLAGTRAPMLAAPTGFGKTRVMAEIVAGALRKGKRVLIVVPILALVEQTVEALELEGIHDIGVMQALHERTDSTASVQVASAQTLRRRRLPCADLIIIDEAHRWFAFFAAMVAEAKQRGVPVIGLSATPWTKGLGRHFDGLLQAATTQELIDASFLSPFRVFAPSHPDLEGVRTVAGDFHEGELAAAMNKPDLVADVVSTWLKHGRGRPTLCFGVDRAHAKHLDRQFSAVGVATGYIDAYTSAEDRKDIFARFRAGAIEVLCNVGCLTTGVDLDVRCIVLARPTRSEMLFVQMIGRGLRTAPGKTDCLILDHSDTHLALGLVTDIAYDRLDDGKKVAAKTREQKAPLPRECPSCSYLRPATVSTCPECGFKPERQCGVEVAEGELVAFDRATPVVSQARKTSVFGQLRWIARKRGYTDGWVARSYRDFFGMWPRGVHGAAVVEPEPEIAMWVKARQIAFAKSKERSDARSA